eukprot:TRINITY_DN564_c0_g1_i1.p1 TRINITY_DN564_c0_g1~~TRINITY_DN564_c0_g1_i1.p1  ORF type:complete len:622 (-),score=86.73 TRINITY_DN564_c0_g1_i1:68-1933(-)
MIQMFQSLVSTSAPPALVHPPHLSRVDAEFAEYLRLLGAAGTLRLGQALQHQTQEHQLQPSAYTAGRPPRRTPCPVLLYSAIWDDKDREIDSKDYAQRPKTPPRSAGEYHPVMRSPQVTPQRTGLTAPQTSNFSVEASIANSISDLLLEPATSPAPTAVLHVPVQPQPPTTVWNSVPATVTSAPSSFATSTETGEPLPDPLAGLSKSAKKKERKAAAAAAALAASSPPSTNAGSGALSPASPVSPASGASVGASPNTAAPAPKLGPYAAALASGKPAAAPAPPPPPVVLIRREELPNQTVTIASNGVKTVVAKKGALVAKPAPIPPPAAPSLLPNASASGALSPTSPGSASPLAAKPKPAAAPPAGPAQSLAGLGLAKPKDPQEMRRAVEAMTAKGLPGHLWDVNRPDLETPQWARFFIVKPTGPSDVHRSIKYSVWSSSDSGAKRLSRGWQEAQGRGPVFLVFGVQGTNSVVGMCALTSDFADVQTRPELWLDERWRGKFGVKWLVIKDIPHSAFKHININLADPPQDAGVRREAVLLDVPIDKGFELLKVIMTFRHKSSFLDNWATCEKLQEREDVERRSQRASIPATAETPASGGASGGGSGGGKGAAKPKPAPKGKK